MEPTPLLPTGRPVVESYGDGGFTVAGTRYRGSVLVLPEGTRAWPVAAFEDISLENLQPVIAAGAEIDILLVGCGAQLRPLPPALRAALGTAGIVAEPMDSAAACRTYNVILSEERRVAAALIAVD